MKDRNRCPKCKCFLTFEEINVGVDEDCYEEIVECKNPKCDWKEPTPIYNF